MTNNFLYLGLTLALDVLLVVGLPSVQIWPNDTKVVQMGNIEKYYCRIDGVQDFFVNPPRFFQAKGARIYMQNSSEIDKDSGLLSKTLEPFDEDTEIYCLWKPVKTIGHVFPSTILSQRVAIRYRERAKDTCSCSSWWQWVIAAVVATVVMVIAIALCRRRSTRREQPISNVQQEPSYSYATAPVMNWEDAHALAANNRPLPRYQTVVPNLPPRNVERTEYEYITPSGLRK